MKKFHKLVIVSLAVLFSFLVSCGQPGGNTNRATAQVLVPTASEEKQFYGGSIKIPAGWRFSQTGGCTEMSIVSWDPVHPDRQFFFFGTGGLFYLTEQQKRADANYAVFGGPTPLTGKPVISPLTPENYLQNFYKLGTLPELQQAFQKFPELYNVQIISATPQASGMPGTPATASLVRAVFTDRYKTKVSEGLFLVTVIPYIMHPFNGGPGGSFGMAYSFMGITAPLNELESVLPALSQCLHSFDLSEPYVDNCIRSSNQTTIGIIKAGKTLSEASDNIMRSWENRSRSQDISSQKISDGILGRQRLYDPATKTVYEVDNTFTDKYKLEPNKYNLSNLQQLPPDDYNLWRQPMVQGADHIRRVN